MITAKNYAAQAMRGLEAYHRYCVDQKYDQDANNVLMIVNVIRDAHHFVIPDGGLLLEAKDFSIVENIPFRLPYPKITIEYYDKGGKMVIVAIEKEDRIFVYTVIQKANSNGWLMSPFATIYDYKITLGETPKKILLHAAECLPQQLKGVNITEEQATDLAMSNTRSLCEFIAALSCTNVGTETHQEAYRDNAKRISKGKLPIYETKTLTLNVTGGKKGGAPGGGSSTPKRQHFRRGYIRHLASGNYWVNACIVGRDRNGRIDKDYVVR